MKNNNIKKHYKFGKRGFTLLFAVLIASIALSIGISIFNISIKELRLSSSVRESQFALYAADTGIDCAVFWDLRGEAIYGSTVFATSSSSSEPGSGNGITCLGWDIPAIWSIQRSANSATTTFTLKFSPEPHCLDVEVVKSFQISQETRITSRGHNTCDLANERIVERAIRVAY